MTVFYVHRCSEYLMESAHLFRLTQKKMLNSKNPQKATDGVIWIAKTFPPWQSCVLDTMRELYEVRTESDGLEY